MITKTEDIAKRIRAARKLENQAQTAEGIDKEYLMIAAAATLKDAANEAAELYRMATEAAANAKKAAAAAAAERRAK